MGRRDAIAKKREEYQPSTFVDGARRCNLFPIFISDFILEAFVNLVSALNIFGRVYSHFTFSDRYHFHRLLNYLRPAHETSKIQRTYRRTLTCKKRDKTRWIKICFTFVPENSEKSVSSFQ